MKRMCWALTASLLSFVVLSAQTSANNDQDGYKLRLALQSDYVDASREEFAFNLGYVAGIAVALDGEAFCLPVTPVRFAELKEVVLKYMNDHPTILHRHRSFVIGVALADAYPCKKKTAKWQSRVLGEN
jgi:hypothetical protein